MSCMGLRAFVRRRVLALAVLLVLAHAARADSPNSEPVRLFQEALRASLEDLKNQDPDLAKRTESMDPNKAAQALNAARGRILAKRVAALKDIPDLRRALTLAEWNRDPQREPIFTADAESRKVLIKRFEDEVRQVLKNGTPASRLAALHILGEVGSIGVVSTAGGGNFPPPINQRENDAAASPDARTIGSLFAEDLADLTKQTTSAEIRAAAARTLGKVHAQPKISLPALARLLESQSPSDRQATVEALISLIRNTYSRDNAVPGNTIADTGTLFDQLQAILKEIPRGLRDSDSDVRRLSAAAVRETILVLGRLEPEAGNFNQSSAAGNPGFIEQRRRMVQDYRKQRPVLVALRDQIADLAPLLKDSDLKACLAGNQAVEAIADLRLRRLELDALVETGKPVDDLWRGELQKTIPLLAAELSVGDIQVKLAALYALESLAAEASSEIDPLLRAAQDKSYFVRWGVVRTLGKMAPRQADKAAPVLGKLLSDENGDVRITAAAALERFGPAGKAAVAELATTLSHKDSQTRTWALRALIAMGAEAAPAIGQLKTALKDSEIDNRVAAARALSRLGPAAVQAVDALRAALDDPNPQVRDAVSDALFAIK
jgi:HEAT repeat protein